MNICKHDEYCGGCIYQGVPYEEQLKIKEKQVIQLLKDKDAQVLKMDGIEAVSYTHLRAPLEWTVFV